MSDEDSENYQTIVEWLASLPPEATLRWGDDSMAIGQPYGRSFVDVAVLPEQAPQGFNWVWTIIGPDHPGADHAGQCTLVVDYDLDLYELRDPEGSTEQAWVVPPGQPLPAEARAALDAGRAVEGRACLLFGAWSHQVMSAALEQWIAQHAGRSDIHMGWHPEVPSPMLDMVKRALAEAETETESETESETETEAVENLVRALGEDPMGWAEAEAELACEEAMRARSHRIRWLRTAARDPAFAWLAPAEVRLIMTLPPHFDVLDWAARMRLELREDAGQEPRIALEDVVRALGEDPQDLLA